jgi:hypothetical protein
MSVDMPDSEITPIGYGSVVEIYRAHAEFHLRADGVSVGAAVMRSTYEPGAHVWDCIVSDQREWHYIRVLSEELGPFPSVSPEAVEHGVERFASTLPSPYRIRHLVNANPLHIDSRGTVDD